MAARGAISCRSGATKHNGTFDNIRRCTVSGPSCGGQRSFGCHWTLVDLRHRGGLDTPSLMAFIGTMTLGTRPKAFYKVCLRSPTRQPIKVGFDIFPPFGTIAALGRTSRSSPNTERGTCVL